MKKLFLTITILVSIAASSQVGINTSTPTSTLDVNGDARVRIMNKANTPDFILAADSNGKLLKTGLTVGDLDGNSDTSGVSILKNQYFGTLADPTKTIIAGIIEVRLYPRNGTSTTEVYPQLRLASPPTSNIQVVVLDDETWPTGGTQGSGIILTFTTSDWSNWKNVGNNEMVVNEKNILTFAVPGTKDLYRVTCYVVTNSGGSAGQERLYNLISEKF